jgi:DNA invertase Pin-like site-specific DNA recombinase
MTYGYLRVSTDKQDENNQKLGVVEKARRMCVEIDEFIIDAGVSGTKEPEKRKLGVLMEKLKPGDLIIASELSRLGRSLYMIMRILEYCMKHKVKVVTVKDGYELGDNLQSTILAFAFGIAAEIERDMISRRTKEALQRRIKDGILMGRPRGSMGNSKLLDHYETIRNFLIAGYSYSKIGRELKVHRNTVIKFCEERGLLEFYNTPWKGSKKPLQQLPIIDAKGLRGKLKRLVTQSQNYNQMEAELGLTASSIRKYIQRDKALYALYVEKQNKIRVKRNGGMKINKAYREGITYEKTGQ